MVKIQVDKSELIKLQKVLPAGPKQRWDASISESFWTSKRTAHVHLEIELDSAYSRHTELEALLAKNDIPVDRSRNKPDETYLFRKTYQSVDYYGEWETLGSYVLFVWNYHPTNNEEGGGITLCVEKELGKTGKSFGEMWRLVDVVKQYVELYHPAPEKPVPAGLEGAVEKPRPVVRDA